MAIADNFTEVQREPWETVWLHKEKPVWIVFYENSTHEQFSFYQAYRPVSKVPSGRDPWTVDNRRLGPADRGFKTLETAMQAAEAA